MDLADNTVGIHAAASTFISLYSSSVIAVDLYPGRNRRHAWRAGLTDVRWFLKYTFVSTLLFNVVLILTEAFTF